MRLPCIYDLHRNDPDDGDYRNFLARLVTPLMQRLHPGMEGLDYGYGPGPALAQMLTEAGMRMALYDPFYAPDTAVLNRTYDFVTCTETAEHFRRPGRGLETIGVLAASRRLAGYRDAVGDRPGTVLPLAIQKRPDPRQFLQHGRFSMAGLPLSAGAASSGPGCHAAAQTGFIAVKLSAKTVNVPASRAHRNERSCTVRLLSPSLRRARFASRSPRLRFCCATYTTELFRQCPQ